MYMSICNARGEVSEEKEDEREKERDEGKGAYLPRIEDTGVKVE